MMRGSATGVRQRMAWLSHTVFNRTAIICLTLAVLAGCAAKPPATKSTPTLTPSAPLPWTVAIGSLTERGTSHICTASLVRPNLILTAAHCLYPPSRTLAADHLVFTPNAGRTPVFDPLPVRAVQVLGGQVHEGHIDALDVAMDWAFLKIVPAPRELQPLPIEALSSDQVMKRLAAGDHFYSAGFGGGDKAMLRQHDDCDPVDPRSLGLDLPGGITVSTCIIRPGDSGGPMVLLDTANKPHLFAVISSLGQRRGGLAPIGLGVSAGAFAHQLDRLLLSSAD
ncbi:trypsin-like serine peptidase [Dongia soli]|uniref:Trypsin-like serine protease n=1 Tax=Dongia soli TaxID=600628 RepID=A0ABU5EA13_9PROT|nr:trypsin-like serine protease [Dongia soli]MDY0882378.1 trypsin-like serine protease [Dongia soli]